MKLIFETWRFGTGIFFKCESFSISMMLRASSLMLRTRGIRIAPIGMARHFTTENVKESLLDRAMKAMRVHPEQLIAGEGYNRWRNLPAAVATHLCLGSVYAWSIFNQPLTRLDGVLVPAGGD